MSADIKIKEMQNVGHAKYVVNYCTGKKHKRIFSNKRKKNRFITSLKAGAGQ